MNTRSRRFSSRPWSLFGALLFFATFLSAAPFQWEEQPGYRSALLPSPTDSAVGFRELDPAKTGLLFTNRLRDETAAANQVLMNGSGAALGDIDGDGLCDIFLPNLEGSNALFKNLGDWRFEEVTRKAGFPANDGFSTGALLADIDADGDLDLLVTSIPDGAQLFLNDGTGRFTAKTDSGLLRRYGACSMALADIDGDSDLDLYVANYRTNTIRSTGLQILSVGGKLRLKSEQRDAYEITEHGRIIEHGEPHLLYRNLGEGRFEPVSWTDGTFSEENGKPLLKAPRDWGLSVQMRDINGDGAPDIYVCNDFQSPDRIWINDGAGRFRAASQTMIPLSSWASMGVDFADINRDGYVDFVVAEMLSPNRTRFITQRDPSARETDWSTTARPQVQRNTLFLNGGDHTFREIAQYAGLQASEWTWSVGFLDVDLDGFEDLLVTTGHLFDTQDADTEARIQSAGVRAKTPSATLLMHPQLEVPNMAFRNMGNGKFEDVSAAWNFNAVGVSHGMAFADLDNDGDLDVVVNNLNRAASLYQNQATAPRLAIRLKGRDRNRRGIGALIRIGNGEAMQMQEMIAGGRYLSSDDSVRVFAGTNGLPVKVEVQWRSGKVSQLASASFGHIYEVEEPNGLAPPPPASLPTKGPAMFTEASSLLQHRHRAPAFSEFDKQPLLRNRWSTFDAPAAWQDVNGDGWEDLALSSGHPGKVEFFVNTAGNKFHRVPSQAGVGYVTSISGSGSRIVITSADRDGQATNAPVFEAEIWAGGINASSLPLPASNVGPAAGADVDGDDDLDLFFGGRCKPGHYPLAMPSHLLRKHGDTWEKDTSNDPLFSTLGIVNGAVFSDVDSDGDPDLLLAIDWGSLKLLLNDKGKFRDASAEFGLDKLRGRWNGITTADFNNDGLPDIAASNWGRNTSEERFSAKPLALWHGQGEFTDRRIAFETYFEPQLKRWVPWSSFDELADVLPKARGAFSSAKAFSTASVEEILAADGRPFERIEIDHFETVLLLNRKTRFEPKPLPWEVQLAPAFGMVAGDFDNDGHHDLFLAQNFLGTHSGISPFVDGQSLMLKGRGDGSFDRLSAAQSGVQMHGEQRAVTTADFDNDGRLDLCVTRFGGATALFKNTTAAPGLRIRLIGNGRNLSAIGAVLRADSGPARELRAGEGFGSQNGLVQIVPRKTETISIRWAKGSRATHRMPTNVAEITVSQAGELKVVR